MTPFNFGPTCDSGYLVVHLDAFVSLLCGIIAYFLFASGDAEMDPCSE